MSSSEDTLRAQLSAALLAKDYSAASAAIDALNAAERVGAGTVAAEDLGSDVAPALAADPAFTNPTVTVTRSATTGKVSSVVDGSATITVARDQYGRVTSITTGSTTRTVTRNTNGRITGVS